MDKTTVKWGRIGMRYSAEDLDVTGIVDMERLELVVAEEVDKFLQGPFAVRMTVRVELDGGAYHNLPFGYGVVQVEHGD